jgi:hypothetical protein
MTRSLSPIQVQQRSHSFQEESQHFRERTTAGLLGQLRTSDPQWLLIDEGVRRERRWTSAGATPARELVRSTR